MAQRGIVSVDVQRASERFRSGANANPNASNKSDIAITVIFPLVTYGVLPDVPCTRASSTPVVKVGSFETTSPFAAITAVMPVLVARSIGRPVSIDRMRAI
jgi:hypothetical protein